MILEVVFPNESFVGYVVNVTDPATLECIAYGIPPPTIQWFQSDIPLATEKRTVGAVRTVLMN